MPAATRTATKDTATAPRRLKANPARRSEIEDWLDSKGVEWDFIPEFPIADIDIEKGLGNQARVFTKLDTERVATYAEGVERGDAFPGVILHKSSKVKSSAIDGNHRIAAYLRANKTSLPVYLVTKVQPRNLVMMTFEANVKHGLPTTHDERLYQAAWLMDNGASEGQAAAAVNVKAADVRKYWAKRKADTRSKEVGINRTVWDALPQSTRNRLANINTDEGFKAAAELAFNANLSSGEVWDLVQRLQQIKSSSRQEAAVKAYATELRERIQEAGSGLAVGGKRARTPKQVFNMALGQFSVLPENPETIADTFHGEERPEAAKRAREAAEHLTSIAELLEAEPA